MRKIIAVAFDTDGTGPGDVTATRILQDRLAALITDMGYGQSPSGDDDVQVFVTDAATLGSEIAQVLDTMVG
jgi:hypothetical protein